MSDDVSRRAKKLFLEVSGLPGPERDARLEQECAGDAAFRAEVESLLAGHDEPDRTATTADASGHSEPSPTPSIGPYRVIREIGRGGMGVVYLGERESDQFRRRVAIKVLRRGMDTEDVLRRFELERQVLAALNHPGIARLYDAGETDEGMPYFVMEHVEGEELEAYCDLHRLHIDERLELFGKVCAAVHYAHQNLVVHRDLKPSNILITEDGQPKLLDFGIAKIINPQFQLVQGDPTAPELRVMTPEYASPEQVRGSAITTASDVYSLGVLLYELLCGHAPYRLRSRMREELVRVICEEDPERPSTAISRVEEVQSGGASPGTTTITPESVGKARESRPEHLRRALAGDIDNIVLMAMRKEPQRRYASAEQLAEDIRRHIDKLPVIARRDTLGYRVSKFMRRNRTGVAAAAVMVLLLVGGIVGTTRGLEAERAARADETAQRMVAEQARDAEVEQRRRADRSRAQMLAMSRTFMDTFADIVETLDGSIPARELLVTTALQFLEGLHDEAAEDAQVRREIASAIDRLGDISGGIRSPNKGDPESALRSYRSALAIRQDLADAEPGDLALRKDLATSHVHIGDVRLQADDLAGALETHRIALRLHESILETDPTDATARRDVAIALANVGAVLLRMARSDQARDHYDRSLALRRELAKPVHEDPRSQRGLSVILIRIAFQLEQSGEYEESLRRYEEALHIRRQLVASDPANVRWQRDAIVATYYVINMLVRLERSEAALRLVGEYLAVSRRLALQNPESARTQGDLGTALDLVGQVHALRHDWKAALRHYREGLTVVAALSEARPDRTTYRLMTAIAREHIAEALAATGNAEAAMAELEEALGLFEALSQAAPDDVPARQDVARVLIESARLLAEEGRSDEARRRVDRARELLEGDTTADADGLRAKIEEYERR